MNLIAKVSFFPCKYRPKVNYFGVVMVTKAMLPLLKKSIGSRIINVSSTAGHGSMAALGAYSGNNSHNKHTRT